MTPLEGAMLATELVGTGLWVWLGWSARRRLNDLESRITDIEMFRAEWQDACRIVQRHQVALAARIAGAPEVRGTDR